MKHVDGKQKKGKVWSLQFGQERSLGAHSPCLWGPLHLVETSIVYHVKGKL